MAAIPTQWEEWGSWSKCTSSCGGGSKVRIRGCPTEPASACDGDPTETATCSSDSTNLGVFLKAELFLFLVHLAGNRKFLLFSTGAAVTWAEWGEWSECEPTWFNGKKFRFRNCNNAPSADACDGDPNETAPCSESPNPGCLFKAE